MLFPQPCAWCTSSYAPKLSNRESLVMKMLAQGSQTRKGAPQRLSRKFKTFLFTLWSSRRDCNFGRENRSTCRSEQGVEGVIVEAPVKVAYVNFGGSDSCGHGQGASRAASVSRVRTCVRTWMRADDGIRMNAADRAAATIRCGCDGRRASCHLSGERCQRFRKAFGRRFRSLQPPTSDVPRFS